MKHTLYALFFMATSLIMAQTETTKDTIINYSGSRPDGHAPIYVMGDHTHGKGEFMLSYKFMQMNMEDILVGNNNASSESLLMPNGGAYMVTPLNMPMQMHMFGAMYAPSNNTTLYVMANYMSMEMDHITAMNMSFTTKSSGLGDTKVGILYNFWKKKRSKIHGNFGLSLPTGSIDNEDVTPASGGNNVILPYPMQTGSGTIDLDLGATYLTQGDVWSFGSQLKGLIRVDENNNGYTLGNRYSLNNWFAVKANNWISFSARLEGVFVEGIKSANPDLNPNMIITANTSNSGGEFINSGLGVNFYVPKGPFKNLRLGLEYAEPLFQNVNGIQLKTEETFTAGLQYAF